MELELFDDVLAPELLVEALELLEPLDELEELLLPPPQAVTTKLVTSKAAPKPNQDWVGREVVSNI